MSASTFLPAARETVRQSPTLAANERIRDRIAAGAPIVHLAFGEVGLPVLPSVANALREAVGRNTYGSVVGSAEVRAAAAGWFTRRGLPTDADQIVMAPGSKALLFALLSVLPGDVVLPRPSWVSYAAQARLIGKRVVGVPIPPTAGGVPDPDVFEGELARARLDGCSTGILVLTSPDNPTGTVPDRSLVRQVCEIAAAHGLAIVSDEIYRDLAYNPASVASAAEIAPAMTFVTGGLSKSMALGGWRIGFARTPDSALGHATAGRLIALASEVWSSLAAPLQSAAAFVLDDPADVRAHVAKSRRLHREVTLAVHNEFMAAGAECRPPTAAFYLFPDLEPLRSRLAKQGVRTSPQLAEMLLKLNVGVLDGTAFGDHRNALRFRVAVSLLYGTNEQQQWEALGSDDPTSLPWIDAALRRLRDALTALR